MWDLVLRWLFWALFLVGVFIEAASVCLDIRMTQGRGRVSGAWGVAFGLFAFLLGYSIFLASKRPEGATFTMEIKAVVTAITFQIVFHVLIPLIVTYRIGHKDNESKDC